MWALPYIASELSHEDKRTDRGARSAYSSNSSADLGFKKPDPDSSCFDPMPEDPIGCPLFCMGDQMYWSAP